VNIKSISALSVLLLFAAFSSTAARTVEPYYCTAPGTTLYYERYDAASSKLIQKTTIEIKSLKDVPEGKQVNYVLTLYGKNGRPMYGGGANLHAIIGKQSEVLVSVGANVGEMLKNYLGVSNVTVKGRLSVLPADMAPGDVLADSQDTVTVAGFKIRVDVTKRKVLRYDKLVTPVGTLDCVVVRERKAETGPGHNKDDWNENWYAKGYGYVRHDVFDKKGRLKYSETLVNKTVR
jgi:hypothetical protein